MILNYIKSESIVKPEPLDTSSSNKVVYLRRNIVKKQREAGTDEEIQTYFEYDEAKLTKEEYSEYIKGLAIIDIEQQRADIDYIALMSGISLEDSYE